MTSGPQTTQGLAAESINGLALFVVGSLGQLNYEMLCVVYMRPAFFETGTPWVT